MIGRSHASGGTHLREYEQHKIYCFFFFNEYTKLHGCSGGHILRDLGGRVSMTKRQCPKSSKIIKILNIENSNPFIRLINISHGILNLFGLATVSFTEQNF